MVMKLVAGLAHAGGTKSMKGWELYSWSAGHTDRFALLAGTNRNKSASEIRRAPLTLAEVEAKLATLASGEQVTWTVPDRSFSVIARAAVQAACDQHHVTLVVPAS